MRIPRHLTVSALTVGCLVLGAAPAALARSHGPVRYAGKTRHGDPIRFTLDGSRITKIKAYVPTLCLATEGMPLSGTDAFDPPGSFRLGHAGKASAKRPNALWNSSDVTK